MSLNGNDRLPDEGGNDTKPFQSTGEEFVKKIGLLGAILFIIMSILGIASMLVGNRGITQQPEPVDPYSSAYHAYM